MFNIFAFYGFSLFSIVFVASLLCFWRALPYLLQVFNSLLCLLHGVRMLSRAIAYAFLRYLYGFCIPIVRFRMLPHDFRMPSYVYSVLFACPYMFSAYFPMLSACFLIAALYLLHALQCFLHASF